MPSKSGSGSAVLPGGSALPPPLSVATAHHLTTLSHILQVRACHLTTLSHMLSHTLSRILQVRACHATHACGTCMPASCVIIMCHQHVSSSCVIINMCQHHVSASCVSIMCQHHVSASCVGIMCQHHVSSSCVIIMCHQHVSSTCVIIMYQLTSIVPQTHKDCAQLKPCLPLAPLSAPRSMHASPTSSPHSGSPSSSTSWRSQGAGWPCPAAAGRDPPPHIRHSHLLQALRV